MATNSSNTNFGIVFLRRQWRLFGVMFQSISSASSIMFMFLVVLSLAFQFIIYEAGLIPSMYFEVLGAKDYDAFRSVAVYSIEIIVLNALMKSSVTYLSQLLYVKWRGMVCQYLHRNYFNGIIYYKLNVSDPELDNMDQRIVRDVNLSCQEWSTLMSRLIVIPFTIVYYSYQCFISTTYLGPVIIYAYFVGGTIINRFLMTPVVRTTIIREKKEGDFRFQHLQVRVNSESMAFYHAEEIEKYKSNNRLQSLLDVQRSLYGWSFFLNSSVNVFDYVGGILSYLIIAIPIFGGQYDDLAPEELSAVISKLFDMARIVSDIAGHTHRLGELLEKFDEYERKDGTPSLCQEDKRSSSSEQDGLGVKRYDNDAYDQSKGLDDHAEFPETHLHEDILMKLKHVSYATPDGTCELLKDLTLTIYAGQNLLVTGGTGCGKTSLFRIICHLWHPSSGSVELNYNTGRGGVMFLPQKPVCTDGTLKQIVTYPSMDGYYGYSLSTDDERIMNVLDDVELTDLCSRFGGIDNREEINWADKLSPGEMQRLSFARLFYHQPKLAVMDEPTSALNTEIADMLFGLCKRKNITCITAGHGDTLIKHHDRELHLDGNGKWSYFTLH